MSDWIIWLVVAGFMVALELFTGTFYLLMIALGLIAGALAALFGWTIEFQVITAGIVGAVATIALRRSRLGSSNKVEVTRDPNVNLDIGLPIQINEWQTHSTGVHTARAMHRGALWDVAYAGKDVPESGTYVIVEIRGSQLIVERGRS
jgi:membrane protein implicated in regulation of membrane protease activity